MTGSSKNRGAWLSVGVCSALVAVGAVRLLSYGRDAGVAAWLLDSPLAPLAYDPEAAWSVRGFKIVSTPVVIAGIYFLFRFFNRGVTEEWKRIDFASPWTRLALTTVVSLHWIPLEWMKFHKQDFYPSSPLESGVSNFWVLLASQAIAFFGMRWLSFAPLSGGRRSDRAGRPSRAG